MSKQEEEARKGEAMRASVLRNDYNHKGHAKSLIFTRRHLNKKDVHRSSDPSHVCDIYIIHMLQ